MDGSEDFQRYLYLRATLETSLDPEKTKKGPNEPVCKEMALVACALGISTLAERIEAQNYILAEQTKLLRKIFGVLYSENHEEMYRDDDI